MLKRILSYMYLLKIKVYQTVNNEQREVNVVIIYLKDFYSILLFCLYL